MLFKKKILRYCLLSWTMLFTQINKKGENNMNILYGNKEAIIEKDLATEAEVLKLQGGHPLTTWTDFWTF